MNERGILAQYYPVESTTYKILLEHGRLVAEKALSIAEKIPSLSLNETFIVEAAMLHDIGIFFTDAPKLGCFGHQSYIAHGYLGRMLLDDLGYPKHGLVCERHVGVGLSIAQIEEGNLPLPRRDMIPISVEEKIICLADKFFSKKISSLNVEKSIQEVKTEVRRYGLESLNRLEGILDLFRM